MTDYPRAEREREQENRKVPSRTKRKMQTQEVNTDFKDQQPEVKIWSALVWSVLISFFSVANPLLSGLATNLQSQNLYAGLAMQAGQSPYGDFFGTNGVLYYLLTALGSSLGSSLGLIVLQFIALFIAGIYFYKIVAYFSKRQETSQNLSFWFYLFVLVLNFGGVYASLFALPFLLTSLWFLIRYFENAVRDEAFILYGIDAALVFMIYPKSIILWLVASLVLLVYNARNRQMARGFYQWLATLFGFLLIVYAVGYYTFIEQILGMAIQQTFLYNISLNFTYDGIGIALVMVVGTLLVSGFLKNSVQTLLSLSIGQYGYLKVLLLLTFLVQTIFIIGNQNVELSQLTVLLPTGFMMALVHRPAVEDDSEEEQDGVQLRYLSSSFFLPLVACVAIVLQPLYTYFVQGDLHQQRQVIAEYIQENSEETDTIYAWDDNAQIYLMSNRLSSARIITAEPFLNTSANKNSLVYDINKSQARYIVVNIKLAMLDEVKAVLESQYSLVDVGTDGLLLYQKNG